MLVWQPDAAANRLATKFSRPEQLRRIAWAVGRWLVRLSNVRIGRSATVSYRSHLCAGTHDLNNPTMPLLKPPIVVGDNVWMGTEAFIGPGVVVGEGAIVGARAVVVKDVPALHIVAGNPARQIGLRETPK